MTLVCFFHIASMAASIAGQSLVFALAASPQLNARSADVATPKEQALIEHACGVPLTPAAYAARERCLVSRLVSLRADFGRDLSELSPVARKKLDTACSPLQASRGREAYVACLSAQLATLSKAQVRATPPARADVTIAAPAATPLSAAPSTPPVPQETSLLSVQLAAAVLAGVAVVAALVFLGVKAKRARRVCRVCGVRVAGAGDLCAPCRREAADAVRHANAERAERQRAHGAAHRQEREHAEEQRREQLRQEHERLRRLEEGRRLEEETPRRAEAERQTAEDARQAANPQLVMASAAWDAADSVFDPYGALGLVPNASGDEVRAAYEGAKLKYDPDHVAHLGDELQELFAAKSRAAERAYRLLADGQ
jgi:hypothetical protein